MDGEPVCSEDKVSAEEIGPEGESVEESAFQQVRVKFHHVQGQLDPFLLGFVGQGGGRQSADDERQDRKRHLVGMEILEYFFRVFHDARIIEARNAFQKPFDLFVIM